MKNNLLQSPRACAAAVLLLFVLLLPATVGAYDFEVDDLAYKINPDGKSVAVVPKYETVSYYSSVFEMICEAQVPYPNLSEILVPDEVKYNGKTYPVTEISADAFHGRINMIIESQDDVYNTNYAPHRQTIEIGKNVKFIDEKALWCDMDYLIIDGDIDFVADEAITFISYTTIIIKKGVTTVENLGINNQNPYLSVVSFCKNAPKSNGFLRWFGNLAQLMEYGCVDYLYIPNGSWNSYKNEGGWIADEYENVGEFSGEYPQSIELEKTSVTIQKGKEESVRCTTYPANELPLKVHCSGNYISGDYRFGHYDENYHWISDPEITIRSDTEGEGNVYAFFGFTKSPVCNVTVVNGFTITLDRTSLQMNVNERQILNVSFSDESSMYNPLIVSSSDPEVAKATLSGKRVMVTALANGTATITVADSKGEYHPATCEVTVGNPVPETKGDIDGDGKTDVTDLNLLVNALIGKIQKTAAHDINGDNNVDVSDINELINIMLGK